VYEGGTAPSPTLFDKISAEVFLEVR